jgi:hypothetical protein
MVGTHGFVTWLEDDQKSKAEHSTRWCLVINEIKGFWALVLKNVGFSLSRHVMCHVEI